MSEFVANKFLPSSLQLKAMRLATDERGQAIQIGAVLIFAILIIVLSLYQAFVIPDQNEEIEFDHNQELQQQLTELRSTAVSMVGSSTSQSTSVDLGVRYPSRTIFVNPTAPSGNLRTIETTNESHEIVIRNATVPDVADNGEGDFWNDRDPSFNTGALEYRPNYNLYNNAPRTVFEHTVLFNDFDRQQQSLPLTGQSMYSDGQFTLLALNGSYDETRVDSAAVDFRPLSTNSRILTVEPESGTDHVTIELPTTIRDQGYEEVFQEEIDDGDISVEREGDRLAIHIHDARVDLELAKIGVGTGATPTTATYIVGEDTPTSLETGQKTDYVVEVRDEFNNPVSGVEVEAYADDDDAGQLLNSEATTDSEGQAIFRYEAPGTEPADDITIQFSYANDPSSGGFDRSEPENFAVDVDVTAAGAGANFYDVSWDIEAMQDQDGVAAGSNDADLEIEGETGVVGQLNVEAGEAAHNPGTPLQGVGVELSTNDRSLLQAAQNEPNSAAPDDTGEVLEQMAGVGTETEPYVITNDHELQAIVEDDGAYYILGNSIDASETDQWNGGAGFEPVSLDEGSLDGNGYLIEGLTVDRGGDNNVGLFSELQGASVTRLGLVDVDMSGRWSVGGLAGEITESDTTNVFVTGSVVGEQEVGGIGGVGMSSSIVESYSKATVDGDENVGGLVGHLDGGIVADSYAQGDVDTGNGDVVGGFVGENEGTIQRSYAAGTVSGDEDVGGFAGNNEDGEIEDAYWDHESSPELLPGDGVGAGDGDVVALETDEMQGEDAEDNMDGFAFGTTWITVSDDYPALAALGAEPSASVSAILPPGSTDDDGVYAFDFGTGEDGQVSIFASAGDDGDELVIQIGDAPAQSSLDNLDIAGQGETATIDVGDNEDVTVDVENTGGEGESFEVDLQIIDSDNEIVVDDSDDVFVSDGDTTQVTFEEVTSDLDADEYDVQVSTEDDEVFGSLTVVEEQAQLAVEDFTIEDTFNNESFTVDITVEETEDIETENLDVTLAVEHPNGTTVYDETIDADEIQDDQITVTFGEDDGTDELGPFDADEDDYTATATANADNAEEDGATETFNVDAVAESALSNLDIDSQGDDASITEGDDEDISVDVENVGDLDGEFDVTLQIIDTDENVAVDETREDVTVDADATETVTFEEVTGDLDSDDYNVEVSTANDQISGSLTVEEEDEDDADNVNGVDGTIDEATIPGGGREVTFDIQADGEVNLNDFEVSTHNELEDREFTDIGSEFDGEEPPTSFNGQISVVLQEFEDSAALGVQEDFVDPEGADADIIVTLIFEDGSERQLGITSE